MQNARLKESQVGIKTAGRYINSLRYADCCCSVPKRVRLFGTPWAAAHQASLSCSISRTLLKLMSIESVMPSNNLILCLPLLLLPSIFRRISVFSNESALWFKRPKYWSFNFSISPSNEYSELISFRIDWLISLQFKGLSSVLQHHNLKASVSSVLSLLYGPTLTSVHYWKKQNFDFTDLCWQWHFCFWTHCLGLSL